jgi:hypothetical protein
MRPVSVVIVDSFFGRPPVDPGRDFESESGSIQVEAIVET